LDAPVILHKRQETKMTYEIEIQIEELRTELRNAVDGAERRQIQAELEMAQAELIVAGAELDGLAEAEPPF
jgi:phosphoglycerate-specific signal transduction histidine kinase